MGPSHKSFVAIPSFRFFTWTIAHSLGYFNQAVEVLQSNGQFQKVPPFRIRLERFGFSPNSKYLHLQVSLVGVPQPVVTKGSKKKGVQPQETPLEVLHKVLSQAFPSCVPSGIQPNITNTKKVTRGTTEQHSSFSPHMTVGQIPQEEIQAKCDEFQANWVPIEFDVTHIHFLSRKTDSEKMKILQSLPLLGK